MTERPSFVLVTGSSTGIGKACALNLARSGFQVLAGVRKMEDAAKLEIVARSNLQGIVLDIADPESVASAAAKISGIVGDSGLAGLVNNAGIGVHGPVEFLTRDDWRRQFEVNVFGHADVTRALLPLLRKYVTSHGQSPARVIFIGSIAGRVSLPIMSPYCASKHAIAAIASALRMELRHQKIFVCLIEPGAIQSEIWRKGDETVSTLPPDAPVRDFYGTEIDAIAATSRESAAGAIPADVVARLVHECMISRHPPRRRTVGRDATIAALFRRFAPESVFDKVLLRGVKLK
jgi:NAD(P)-dependent dehydrogenase (short-subunit alcohol dehydrogenase family)